MYLNRDKLIPKLKIVADCFLFSCCTGLRYIDICKLKNDEIVDGWIIKKQKKTKYDVDVPLSIFNGLALKIIDEYGGKIENLTKKMTSNGDVNKKLKEIYETFGIDYKTNHFTYHTSRHTFSNLLSTGEYNLFGDENEKTVLLPDEIVSQLLGHTSTKMLKTYLDRNKTTLEKKLINLMN